MTLIAITALAAIAIGVFAEQRYRGQAEKLSQQILTLMLWVLMPFVVFVNVANLQLDFDAGAGIGFGYIAIALVALSAWLISTRVLRLPRATTGAVIVTAMLVNTGYLGLPMLAALLGTEKIGEGAVFDTLITAPSFLLGAFAVGAIFGDGSETLSGRLKLFFLKNPPLFAVIAALLIPSEIVTDWMLDFSHIATFALAPLGFFAVGVALESEEGSFRFPPPITAPVAVAVGLRLIAGPLLLLALATPFIELPDSYLLLASMPCGINSVVVAHACKLDLRVTASAVAWSTAIVILVASVVAGFT